MVAQSPAQGTIRPAATTSAVAMLALRTGAPVIPVFALPLEGGRYRLVYEAPVEPPADDDPDPVHTYTQRCTDVLEMYVRRYPELWLWMHRRWRADADGVEEEVAAARDLLAHPGPHVAIVHGDGTPANAFVRGTEPTAYCSHHEHRRLAFPYPFQRYALNEGGALVIPERELRALLDAELDVYLVDGGKRLEHHGPSGTTALDVVVEPGGDPRDLPVWLTERFDAAEWLGVDGRVAEVIWLD